MRKKIYLLKLGKIDHQLMEFLEENLKEIYPFDFVSEELRIELDNAFNPIRKQYLSTPIILRLKREKTKDSYMCLGILDVDIYADGLNFIFGEADSINSIAIISLKRLEEGFYGKKENSALLRIRALKEAVHEIGHLFGLRHCKNPLCVMFFSNSLDDTDRKLHNFCNSCKTTLEEILKNEL